MNKDQKEEQVRIILALLISFLVLFLSQMYFAKYNQPKTLPAANKTVKSEIVKPSRPRRDIDIDGTNSSLNINLTSGMVEGWKLAQYKQTLDEDSPSVTLFEPTSGYVGISYNLPTALSWQEEKNASSETSKTLTLSAKTGNIKFTRTFTFDDSYSIKITDKITNTSNEPIKITPQARMSETESVDEYKFATSGLIGRIDNKQIEESYKNLEKKMYAAKGSVNWIGFTSRYFLKSFAIGDKNAQISAFKEGGQFALRLTFDEITIAPNTSEEITLNFFGGPKQVDLLKSYNEKLSLTNFDLAIDYGFWFFLTKPFLKFLNFLASFTKNYGLAILLFTLILKLITYPVTKKSIIMSAKMKKAQPQIMRISEVFANDPMRRNMELAALYKKYDINPLSGCLPMFIQIPIFFALYKVLIISIELRGAPFFGWIHDLSVADPTNIFNLFGLLSFTPPSFLHIGAWPIIMGLTMFLQQRLMNKGGEVNPQMKMMQWMPVLLVFITASVPVGIVIYWAMSNVLTIIQQQFLNKKVEKF